MRRGATVHLKFCVRMGERGGQTRDRESQGGGPTLESHTRSGGGRTNLWMERVWTLSVGSSSDFNLGRGGSVSTVSINRIARRPMTW